MEFLVILIAWLLLQWLGPSSVIHRDNWLSRWHASASTALAALPQPLRLLVVVLLPALLVALLAALVEPALGGLLLFLLQLLVLSYSLGRGDFNSAVDAYLERWQRGDFQAAWQVAQQHDAIPVVGGELASAEDCATLHRQMRGHLAYGGFERWFAVVFWFFLLGPAAALLYRSLRLMQRRGLGDEREQGLVARWLLWLEWLPARLLGLAFALTGNFVDCFRVWRESLAGARPTRELLAGYEGAALSARAADAGSCTEPQFLLDAARELGELRDMLRRSAITWLVVLAMLQLLM